MRVPIPRAALPVALAAVSSALVLAACGSSGKPGGGSGSAIADPEIDRRRWIAPRPRSGPETWRNCGGVCRDCNGPRSPGRELGAACPERRGERLCAGGFPRRLRPDLRAHPDRRERFPAAPAVIARIRCSGGPEPRGTHGRGLNQCGLLSDREGLAAGGAGLFDGSSSACLNRSQWHRRRWTSVAKPACGRGRG